MSIYFYMQCLLVREVFTIKKKKEKRENESPPGPYFVKVKIRLGLKVNWSSWVLVKSLNF